jgi:predicted TPR repeat methyltransferase
MSRYPVKSGRYSSHAAIQRLVREHISKVGSLKVLDVGCAQGDSLSEFLSDKVSVTGIEPYKGDADIASARGYSVLNSTIEAALGEISNLRFDLIIVADVLEHLINPDEILIQLISLLKKDGLIFISVPNVANVTTRISLLFGRFNYSDRGILDRTHLRFFTQRTFFSLISSTEVEKVQVAVTPIPFEILLPLLNSPRVGAVLQKVIHLLTGKLPRLLGYQFTTILRKLG